jgi:hypothetical protein
MESLSPTQPNLDDREELRTFLGTDNTERSEALVDAFLEALASQGVRFADLTVYRPNGKKPQDAKYVGLHAGRNQFFGIGYLPKVDRDISLAVYVETLNGDNWHFTALNGQKLIKLNGKPYSKGPDFQAMLNLLLATIVDSTVSVREDVLVWLKSEDSAKTDADAVIDLFVDLAVEHGLQPLREQGADVFGYSRGILWWHKSLLLRKLPDGKFQVVSSGLSY